MSDNLPQEFIREILKRLPMKSVLRFRSVSKRFNGYIKDPSFISSHLQQTSLIFLTYLDQGQPSYSLYLDDDDRFVQLKRLVPPPPLHVALPKGKRNATIPEFKGCSNGLVLFRRDYVELILWNPCLDKYMHLPQPPISKTKGNGGCSVYGLGFNSDDKDFKVLSVWIPDETLAEAHLFSLTNNSWKRVTDIPPPFIPNTDLSASVNGTVYWLGYKELEVDRGEEAKYRNMLLAFDITDEKFYLINLPRGVANLPSSRLNLVKYHNSSIAVVLYDLLELDKLKIWVMNKGGEEEEAEEEEEEEEEEEDEGEEEEEDDNYDHVVVPWKLVLDWDENYYIEALGFRKNEDVLIQERTDLSSINLKTEEMKDLGVRADDRSLCLDSYEASLLLHDIGEPIQDPNQLA